MERLKMAVAAAKRAPMLEKIRAAESALDEFLRWAGEVEARLNQREGAKCKNSKQKS